MGGPKGQTQTSPDPQCTHRRPIPLSDFERIRGHVSSCIPLTAIRFVSLISQPTPLCLSTVHALSPPSLRHSPVANLPLLCRPLLFALGCSRSSVFPLLTAEIMGAKFSSADRVGGGRRGCARRGCRGVGGVCAGPGALICGLFGVCSRAGRASWARFG